MAKGARFHSVSRPSIYMDVAGQIRRAILEGTMSSGERLPPERELARQFGGSRALLLVMLAVTDAIRLHLDEALRARSSAKMRFRIATEHRTILRSIERGAGAAATPHLRQHLRGLYGT